MKAVVASATRVTVTGLADLHESTHSYADYTSRDAGAQTQPGSAGSAPRASGAQQIGDDVCGAEVGARKGHKFGQEVECLAESDQRRLGGFTDAPLG